MLRIPGFTYKPWNVLMILHIPIKYTTIITSSSREIVYVIWSDPYPKGLCITGQIQLCNRCNTYSQKIRDNYVIYACIYHRNNHRKLHIHVSPYMLRSRHIDYIFFLILLLPSVLNPFPIITARFIPRSLLLLNYAAYPGSILEIMIVHTIVTVAG